MTTLNEEVEKYEQTGESEILSAVVLKNGVFVTDADEAQAICDGLNSLKQ